jgi:hypothetical protein
MISVGVIVLLLTAVFATTAPKRLSRQSEQKVAASQLKIAVRQLPHEDGIIPVELRCEVAELSAPNTLERAPCIIINHTNKYISGGAVAISLIVEKDGKLSPDVGFQTFDTFLHPDFRDEHKNNLIPPGGHSRVQSVETSYDDATIRGVKIWIDYVEFADAAAAALGPNRAGLRMLTDIRAGAAKYKKWLVQKYNQRGKSVEEIIPLLESQAIPEELEMKSGDEEQGAIFYRNYARKAYQTKGAQSLIKYLNTANAVANK